MELTFNRNITNRVASKSTMVNTSTIAVRPSCNVTPAMSPSEATFTPSRKIPAHGDLRTKGRKRLSSPTNRNDGRKIPSVASNAEGQVVYCLTAHECDVYRGAAKTESSELEKKQSHLFQTF